ncbi:MAG: TonB-dependent receptor [Gallionella sp.]|nr:TonB-dependent receptor [Gallionella sp.]
MGLNAQGGTVSISAVSIIVLLFSGLAAPGVWAADSSSEIDFLQDFPVVLSASRLTQPVSETPSAMTVIDRKMIDASGARSIPELFRLVPGMYVGYADGHTPVVSYRGSTDGYARRMQVLIDGRTVYLPPYGHVSWAELPLDIGDIERVEVVRGPSAASHGSNSVQGVINILTRPASAGPKAQVSAVRGGGGISDVSARLGNTSENWDYRMTVASRSDHGFDNHGAEEMNDDSSSKLMNIRAAYRPTGSDSIDFQFGYGDSAGVSGKPTTIPDDWDTLREAKTLSNFQQLSWLHTTPENSDVQLSYYHIGQNFKDDRYAVPNPFPGGPQSWIADDVTVHRHEIELQHTLNTSSANRVVWGTGMRYDSVNSPINLPSPVTWKEYRIFAHDEWRMTPSSLLNTGAMVERSPLGQTRVSPRIAYNYHLAARHTLRASTSVAYRNPEMMEVSGDRRYMLAAGPYLELKGAGELSPERTIAREIGYVGQMDDAGSTVDLRVYHDRIDNIIWVDPVLVAGVINPYLPPFNSSSDIPLSFKNDFSATYNGFESTFNFKLGERSNLTANYAHQLVRAVPIGSLTLTPLVIPMSEFYRYADKYSKTVPLNSASLLLAQGFSGGMRMGVGYYYQDRVNVLDRTEGQPIMRRLDLKMAKRFGSSHNHDGGAGGSEIALVIQNALDDNSYSDYNPAAFSKRRIYLAAALEF